MKSELKLTVKCEGLINGEPCDRTVVITSWPIGHMPTMDHVDYDLGQMHWTTEGDIGGMHCFCPACTGPDGRREEEG